MSSEMEEMRVFAEQLWGYFGGKMDGLLARQVGFFRAEVVSNPGDGTLEIVRPFEDSSLVLPCTGAMSGAEAGDQVIAFTMGSLSNAVVVADGRMRNFGAGGGGDGKAGISLLYDYNTGPVSVGQGRTVIGRIAYALKRRTDAEGHLLAEYFASEPTTLTVRFFDGEAEELYSPVVLDVMDGFGSVDIPHAYLRQNAGEHTVTVTMEAMSGTVSLDTRKILFTINTGNLAAENAGLPFAARDVAMRQVSVDSGPDQIWVIGVEDGRTQALREDFSADSGQSGEWNPVFLREEAVDAAVEFDGVWVLGDNEDTYSLETETEPWFFWVTESGTLYGQRGTDGSSRTALASGVRQVSACRGYSSVLFPEQDQGLVAAYVKSGGGVYYRQLVYDTGTGGKVWTGEALADDSQVWESVRVNRLNDYRISFCLSGAAGNLWLITERTYVAQAVPVERHRDGMADRWNGISVVEPAFSYRGTESPVENVPAERLVIDFPGEVFLYGGAEGMLSVSVNGSQRTVSYAVLCEENRMTVSLDTPLAGEISVSVAPWRHYLTGNGIRYMFTGTEVYRWSAYRELRTDQEDGRTDRVAAAAASVSVVPLAELVTGQEDGRTDSVSGAAASVSVLALRNVSTAEQEEARTDRVAAVTAGLTVTQTGEHPI